MPILLQKSFEAYNSYYGLYRAEWCRRTGLPMYSRKDWEIIERERLFTKSRAKREKVNINDNIVCAWYRMQNGYTPLFRVREE